MRRWIDRLRVGGYWILVGLLWATTSCLGDLPDEVPDDEVPVINVLMIGNSLTFWNDLPSVLQALIDTAGYGPARVVGHAFGGYSLQDHWSSGARQAIALGGWDVVVLQGRTATTEETRESLLTFSELFATDAAVVGAQTAMYMVWPSSSYLSSFDVVSESYTLAAEQIDGLLFPVGEAWRAAWARDSSIQLYDSDGGHPSVAGSYLAALVMFEQLTDRSPIGLPGWVRLYTGNLVGAPDSIAAILQEAAAEANATFALPQ